MQGLIRWYMATPSTGEFQYDLGQREFDTKKKAIKDQIIELLDGEWNTFGEDGDTIIIVSDEVMRMSRVTYKQVKQWVQESAFAQTHGIYITASNGYYHIYDEAGTISIHGKTPLECWEKFNLLKQGYYLGLSEK